MKLKQYLKDESLNYKQFAKKLEDYGVMVTPEAVGYWARGERTPLEKETYQAIKDCTGARVTPNDFYEIV